MGVRHPSVSLAGTHYATCPGPLASCSRRRLPHPCSRGTFTTLSTAFNLETNLTPCPSVWQPDYSISPRQLVSPESRQEAAGTGLDVTRSIPPGAIFSLLWHHQRIIMCSTPPPQSCIQPLALRRRRTSSPPLCAGVIAFVTPLCIFFLLLSQPQSSGMQIASDRAIASSISDKWSEIARPGINGPTCRMLVTRLFGVSDCASLLFILCMRHAVRTP